MYYLKDYVETAKLLQYIKLLIFDDVLMCENTMEEKVLRYLNEMGTLIKKNVGLSSEDLEWENALVSCEM